MGIETDSLLLLENTEYILKKEKGYAVASFSSGYSQFNILSEDKGQLFIKKHDRSQRILSGTFFFTATNKNTGDKVEITEGRFDIRY